MKVVVQENSDRDVVGIMNALMYHHEMIIWNPDVSDISEHKNIDLIIFSEVSKIGHKTFNHLKGIKTLFLKCEAPPSFKGDGVTINSLPYCADLRRYPQAPYDKKYACDVLYVNGFQGDRLIYLNKVPKNLRFRVIGTPLDMPNYIGQVGSPSEISTFCVSAELCIDCNLHNAFDLAKIGCNVITNMENTIGIPVYNEDNFVEVITRELSKPKPIINPYDKLIMPYLGFLKHMFQALGVSE